MASQVEEGAVEAVEIAANITKEVFNPLAKLTKGFQNVVLAKGQPKNDQPQQMVKGLQQKLARYWIGPIGKQLNKLPCKWGQANKLCSLPFLLANTLHINSIKVIPPWFSLLRKWCITVKFKGSQSPASPGFKRIIFKNRNCACAYSQYWVVCSHQQKTYDTTSIQTWIVKCADHWTTTASTSIKLIKLLGRRRWILMTTSNSSVTLKRWK